MPVPGTKNIPDHVVAGLDQLAASPPARWPIDQLPHWPPTIERVRAFAMQWDGRARAVGWSDVSLYGVHQRAPYANLAAMGAAFLVALNRGTVVAVDPDAIAIVSPAGSRLWIYRRPPDQGSVLAWALA